MGIAAALVALFGGAREARAQVAEPIMFIMETEAAAYEVFLVYEAETGLLVWAVEPLTATAPPVTLHQVVVAAAEYEAAAAEAAALEGAAAADAAAAATAAETTAAGLAAAVATGVVVGLLVDYAVWETYAAPMLDEAAEDTSAVNAEMAAAYGQAQLDEWQRQEAERLQAAAENCWVQYYCPEYWELQTEADAGNQYAEEAIEELGWL